MLMAVAGSIATGQGALLLQYTFDAGTAADTGTGTPANGTLINGGSFTTNTPGGSGQAYSTGAGVNTYLTTGTTATPEAGPPAKLTALNAFTISFWVNLQAAPAVNDRLVSTWDTGLSNGFDLRINSTSATDMQLTAVVDSVTASSSANLSAPSTNSWLFVAFTYDGSLTASNLILYSGSISAAATQLGTALSVNSGAVSTTGTAFQVGGTGASSADRSPSAFFDDVRVYDTVLTAAELEAVRLGNIPEPSVVGLAGLSLAGLLVRRRRH